MRRLALWRFTACCCAPICMVVLLIMTLITGYIEMDNVVIQARNNMCPLNTRNQRIPKTLHQTWKDANIPEKWTNSSRSCQVLSPEYRYMFWTDEDIERFLLKEYSWFMDTYYSYPYPIQRIDAARLFMLYHYGGVYTDLDIICKHSFEYLLKNLTCHNLVLLETTPVGVTNMVMFATPKHPFIKTCIEALPGRNHMWGPKHVTVMLSAGPTFISHMMRNYPEMSDMFVYSLEERHELFGDLQGKSWHGMDTKVFTIIDHHLKLSIALIASTLVLVLYVSYQLCFKHKGDIYTYILLRHSKRGLVYQIGTVLLYIKSVPIRTLRLAYSYGFMKARSTGVHVY